MHSKCDGTVQHKLVETDMQPLNKSTALPGIEPVTPTNAT